MLKIKNLTKYFGGIKAVDNCSFEIEPNKITALIGPNGAGKTTIFDIISGLLDANSGQIIFEGKNILGLSAHKIAQLGISRSFQHVRLFKNLTILDHLLMVEDDDDIQIFKQFFSKQKISAEKISWYKNLLAKFSIEKGLNDCVADLSYGQRKLLQMMLMLEKPHKILLLDEPVAGINKVIQEKIEELLIELKEKQETVIIIEHDIEFIKKIADQVVVLDEGKVLVEGATNKALKDKRVLEAYLGE